MFAELSVLWPIGGDAFLYLDGGRQALSNPSAVYADAAKQIAQGFTWTVTWPPPQLLISIPYSLLPDQIGVWAWVLTDAVLVVIALVILFRGLRIDRVWTLPTFILVCVCFTPMFEEVRLGQRSGLLLFLGVAAMLNVGARPRLAGALAGLDTSLKFFPAALILAAGPRQWTRFTAVLIGVAGLVLLVTFLPFGSPAQYLTQVLLPVGLGSSAATHDCFQNSTPLLFSRLIGGQSFGMVNASGVWREVTVGAVHLPWLATVLSYVTRGLLIVGTVWASRRSGWAQPFSMSMAFALGALIPGDVYTYQYLCVLPLALILVLRGIENRNWASVAVASICLWFFISSPCGLVFPGLWTVAALGLIGIGVATANQHRQVSVSQSGPSK